MRQLTLRVEDDLAARLRAVAAERGQSVNSFASAVLNAAVDPDLAGDEAAALRERLARAGLLVTGEPVAGRPSEREVARAQAAAGHGRSLSDLVGEGRR